MGLISRSMATLAGAPAPTPRRFSRSITSEQVQTVHPPPGEKGQTTFLALRTQEKLHGRDEKRDRQPRSGRGARRQALGGPDAALARAFQYRQRSNSARNDHFLRHLE